MKMNSLIGCALSVGVLCAVSAQSVAQTLNYPSHPIRVLVPFAPGGPTDIIARVVAAKLTEALGQQVVIDNRAGAGGNIGMGMAVHAPADGYTLLMASSSLMVNPSLYAKPGFDPIKDFVAISCVATSPNVITAHPSQPFKNAKELVAYVKANPGRSSFGSPGTGTTPHLSGELLRLSAGLDISHVPYAGAGPAVQAVLGNQVTVSFSAVPPAAQLIKAGTLRGVALTAPKRSVNLPEVPTASESGVNGIDSDTKQGLLAPRGTPQAIVDRLNREIQKLMQLSDVKERMLALSFDVVADTPQQFSRTIRSEMNVWSKAIQAAQIKVD